MSEEGNDTPGFWRKHWMHGASLVFYMGTLATTVKMLDSRVSRIEDVNPPKMAWQIEEHGNAIARIDSTNLATQAQVAEIKTQLGVIGTKLDTVIDTLKSQQHGNK